MNITASFFGQMITFIILVAVTMKYVWPPIMKAMKERQEKISEGLLAAEKGQDKLKLAEAEAARLLKKAKADAANFLDEAKLRVNQIIDAGKEKAAVEANRLIDLARENIAQERVEAKSELVNKTKEFSIQIAEKIIGSKVSGADHAQLIDQLISRIEETDGKA